jgi:phosphoserine phosphatase
MSILAIVTDLDGTVVDYPNEPYRSTWDAIGDSLDWESKQKWYCIRDNYSNMEEKSLEWTIEQLELLRGKSAKKLIQALLPIPYVEDVKDFFHLMKGKYLTGMVTGGFSLAAELISEDLKLDFCLYNKLNFENPRAIKKIRGMHSKELWLEEYLKEKYPNIKMGKNVCYIGDNGNDISILENVALPVVINPKNDKIKEISYKIKKFSEINDLIKNYNSKL